jgi:thioredoxin-dependent peroxiredoxin
MALEVYQAAPDFTLASTSGKMFTLSKDMKGKPCILYFYPKDFTSGCTREACEFRNRFDFFKEVDIDVIGISGDDLASHIEFQNRHNLPFELLSDTTGEVARAYEATFPLINFKKRVTYLLDESHRIRAVYQNLFDSRQHIHAMIDKIRSELVKQ